MVALGCLRTSLSTSPFYVVFFLFVSGCSCCLVLLGFVGSFLGLCLYLRVMFVVFVFAAVMSVEDYLETLLSIWFTLVILLIILFMDAVRFIVADYSEGIDVILEFNSIGVSLWWWLVCIYGWRWWSAWLMVASSLTFFIGVFINVEITLVNYESVIIGVQSCVIRNYSK